MLLMALDQGRVHVTVGGVSKADGPYSSLKDGEQESSCFEIIKACFIYTSFQRSTQQ